MSLTIGIDIGSVAVKLAIVGEPDDRDLFHDIVKNNPLFHIVSEGLASNHDNPVMIIEYTRTLGRPLARVSELLLKIEENLNNDISGIRVTGSGSRMPGKLLQVKVENEFIAIARGVGFIFPDVRTVFEMGGEKSKFILMECLNGRGSGIIDYQKNGDCAAGTGSFIDQQASRLEYEIDKVGRVAKEANRSARIAGRCSVFAKSDMIHAQQKGYKPPEVLKGLCEAVARNFKGGVTKGKKIHPPVIFVGGVSGNEEVVHSLKELFNLKKDEFIVPDCAPYVGAIGAALLEKEKKSTSCSNNGNNLSTLRSYLKDQKEPFPHTRPLSMKKVIELRDRVKPYHFTEETCIAYLGVDIGSVSTNLVVLDKNGDLIKEIYLRTQARPIEAVSKGMKEIESSIGHRIKIVGVGTTGSGRELIGQLIGADTINDEITAHKTGATCISRKLLGQEVDTIFEIGGQDSKYISLDNGVVVDFTMNEACAAGTGSFLEEQADKLDINIKEEFAKLALKSKTPIRLGERCTVFMERDVTAYQNKGADRSDIVAGLSYSIVHNYLNRVVRDRKIGEIIYFQGGTAYNDAVAAAFSQVLDKQIIVPPHNGVIGAMGMALLAKEKMEHTKKKTKFHGYNIENINYTIREITCKACSNYCDVQEFNVKGEKTYWGDKCSDRFRKKTKTDRKPIIPNLIKLRQELLMDDYVKNHSTNSGKQVIGIPLTMHFYEKLPFWRRYFITLGMDVIVSDKTTRKISNDGIDLSVAEPCHPIKVAHGHVKNLFDKGVEQVFLPNVINAENPDKRPKSHMCPWVQTLCFVIKNVPEFIKYQSNIFSPTIRFDLGPDGVKKQLHNTANTLGFSNKESDMAVEMAYDAQRTFWKRLEEEGKKALNILKEKEREGIILIGRPYNIYDSGINMNIPEKLRNYYGMDVIPQDFLPLDGIKIHDITENMFWNYGKKILAASRLIKQYPNLHIIYITNFKCGPDSYIKHYISDASHKPHLTLQFDGHSNDAGMITRCEAYLDSKRILRNWKEKIPLTA